MPQTPRSPDFTNSRRHPPHNTYGRRNKPTPQAHQIDKGKQREPSTSPLTSPPPSSLLEEDTVMLGSTLIYNARETDLPSSDLDRQTIQVESRTTRTIGSVVGHVGDGQTSGADRVDVREAGTSSRPSLKRARPPSIADLSKHSTSQTVKRGRVTENSNEAPSSNATSAPIPIASKSTSTYTFRPIPINDLVPLSTPPDVEGASSLRARQAAHTPRTPPRDLTDLFLRKPSPSPESRKQGEGQRGQPDLLGLGKTDDQTGSIGNVNANANVSIESSGAGAARPGPLRKGRRKMMTRTESLGETDDLFSNQRGRREEDESNRVLPIIVDAWELSSPTRPDVKLPGSGPNSPAQESPTTPRGIGRSFSFQSPSRRDLKTPSPPRRQAGTGLARTSSLPDSPSGKPTLRHSLSTSATLAGLSGSASGASVGAGRPIRTYGRRQATPDDLELQTGPNRSLQKRTQQPKSSLQKETIFSDPPSDANADGLESEVKGFLLSSPEAHSILKPLGNRAAPVQEDSYAELNKRFGVDVEDEEDFDPDSQGSLGDFKAPPSLADLRSKGENRRFMDELGYLRDGLRDTSLPARRSSAIDILSKCADVAWFERLRICGQVESIYEDFAAAGKGESDEALDLVLLLYLAHLSRSTSDLDVVVASHASEVCEFLVNSIKERRLSLVQNAAGRRKKSPSMDILRSVRISLTASGITEEKRTPLGMASGLLATILGSALEHDNEITNMGSLEAIAVVMVSTVQQELCAVPNRIELYGKGLDLFTADQQPDFLAVLDCVRLVQSLITEVEDCKSVVQDSYAGLAPLLADLLLLLSLGKPLQPLSRNQNEELVTYVLKILLALTQQSPMWSTSFLKGTAPYIGLLRLLLSLKPEAGSASPTPSDVTVIDRNDQTPIDEAEMTNLALGCLFNLVQEDLEHGQAILSLGKSKFDDIDGLMLTILNSIAIGKPCRGSRNCVKGCHCPNRSSAFNHLVQMFTMQQKNKADDAGAAFLSGYLALLFAKVIDHKPTASSQLLSALGEGDRQSKIDLLVSNVIEFRNTYEKFQLQLTKGLQQRLAPETSEDVEIVVDDENSVSTIKHALKIYEALQ